MSMRRLFALGLFTGICLSLLAGCEETKPVSDIPVPDAGAQPGVDPNIANAVQSAQAGQGAPAGPNAVGGPPANGVFQPGEADKVLPPGQPLKIEMISTGSGPKIVLTPNLDLSKGAKMRVTVQRQIPQGVMPNVEFSITAKTPGEDDDGPKDIITFTVTKAVPAAEQPGQSPPNFAKLVEPLKGMKLVAKLHPDGHISDEKIAVPKGVEPAVVQFAAGLQDVLGLYFSPMPSEPVGVGAYWMGADRSTVMDLKVARYRVSKIEKLVGDELVMSVDVRLYVVDPSEAPKADIEAVTMGFGTNGKGSWTLKRGTLVPTSGQLKLPIVLQIAAKNQPERVVPLQFETTAQLLPITAAAPKP
jgi:hypothetical protein